jgi:hypothetical protein
MCEVHYQFKAVKVFSNKNLASLGENTMACYVGNTTNSAHHRDARSFSQSIKTSSKKLPDNRKGFDRAMDFLKWKYGIATRIPGFTIRPALNTPYAQSQALASSGQFHKAAIKVGEVEQTLTNFVNAFLRRTVEHHQGELKNFQKRKVSEAVLSSEFNPALAELTRARDSFVKQLSSPGLPDYEAMIASMNKMVAAEESVEERIRRSLNLAHRRHIPNPGFPANLVRKPMQLVTAHVPIRSMQSELAGLQFSA